MKTYQSKTNSLCVMVLDKLKHVLLIIALFNAALSINTVVAQSWNSIPGTNGTVYAMLYDNATGSLYIGGDFTMVGTVPANRIARWDGSTWSALGTGMNNTVRALSFTPFTGTSVVAAGDFTVAGGNPANRIALWNGASWTNPFAAGMNDIICALTPYTYFTSNYLAAGGNFTTAGGIGTNRLAVWNGSTWAAMGPGVNDTVFALQFPGPLTNYLYVGGSFTLAGAANAKRVAAFYPFGFIGSLGVGIDDGAVYALAYYNGFLYAGGSFTLIGGTSFSRMARWNGNWSFVGTGTNNTVYSFYQSSTVQPGSTILIVGGLFTNAGGVGANSIATWNGTTWGTLGTGMTGGSPTNVRVARDFRATLAASGNFTTAGSVSSNNIALWGAVPVAPTLLSPACGATVPTLTPTLDWYDVLNAWRYRVQLDDNPNFGSLLIDTSGLVQSQYTVPGGVINPGSTYYWRVNAYNGVGTSPYSNICWFNTAVGININTSEIPKEFKLEQNYPNPFNPGTVISYQLPVNIFVTLKVYDVLGSEVVVLVNEQLRPGTYEVSWDASNLPSGVYFYKLTVRQAGSSTVDFAASKKMLVIK